jgi:PAS domain S-box-containing protein
VTARGPNFEEELALSRRREQRIFESNMVGMLLWDESGAITDANDALLSMIGYRRDDLKEGRVDWRRLTPPEFSTLDQAALEEIRVRGACRPFEKEYLHKDGRRIPILIGGATWEPGGSSGVAFVIDISEKQRQERERIETEERLEHVIADAPIILWATDEKGIVTLSVGRALAGLGFQPGQLVGQSVFDLYRDVPVVVANMKRALAGEEFTEVVDVAGRVLETHYAPRRDASGGLTGLLGISMDITERRRAEEEHERLTAQMLEVQKLESLGVMAGGIAHDFNNILTAIIGGSSLALAALPADSLARKDIEDIITAAQGAATLTRQLLAYSGRARFEIRAIDLSDHVREIAALLRTTIPRNVEIKLELATGLPAIAADVAQAQQLVMNLVLNGAEAVGERPGTVVVETGLASQDTVTLRVTDTGHGMDEATKAKIFDPFFTTKFTGRGLGLAAVLGIVRAHKATIDVRSAVGQGSTFTVRFPACEDAARRGGARSDPEYRGSGQVLVIDDDDGTRRVTCRMLGYLGFSALEAADGQLGVEMFRSHADSIRLVILDMTMPNMTGEETLERLRAISANVPVLLASGFSEVEVSRRFGTGAISGFLQKPFTPSTLAAKIRDILAPGS